MNTEEVQGDKLEAVIEKIRRLQALAGNNKSIEEVCTANAIAAKMMEKYRLTQAMVDACRIKLANNFVRQDLATVSKRSSYVEILLSAICKTYSGKWYMTSRGFSFDDLCRRRRGARLSRRGILLRLVG